MTYPGLFVNALTARGSTTAVDSYAAQTRAYRRSTTFGRQVRGKGGRLVQPMQRTIICCLPARRWRWRCRKIAHEARSGRWPLAAYFPVHVGRSFAANGNTISVSTMKLRNVDDSANILSTLVATNRTNVLAITSKRIRLEILTFPGTRARHNVPVPS